MPEEDRENDPQLREMLGKAVLVDNACSDTDVTSTDSNKRIPAMTQEIRSAPMAIAPPTRGPKANAPINIGRHSMVSRRALSLKIYFATVASITLAAVRRPEAVMTLAELKPLLISLFFKIKTSLAFSQHREE